MKTQTKTEMSLTLDQNEIDHLAILSAIGELLDTSFIKNKIGVRTDMGADAFRELSSAFKNELISFASEETKNLITDMYPSPKENEEKPAEQSNE